ncbi:BEM_collapsed_G0010680.mRNA.1.CDS.1 [Saccharomyces cerevisiae]|nr:BEM_HP_G0152370.mRNA.1.CDS.1 [Saccharomyces cerevisiae]CAI5203093.1 BEM_HP_G0101460.mRNA.1.CDS.1 [Saccharomyces cerevisiae]CAI6688406.1 BEM_HP_G0152370.mRNA.1.CDS.1 [Saccharomyces cerevisiae]CAI7007864.1 BEM_HP_G0101460.mRNA.1.CDS.1 [Saccharomyces cerevisiae]CAI7074315.1 BEM_collapsed_G0010680.mRNA.1.CDS.1 [Saccharomyces cerevisiae]
MMRMSLKQMQSQRFSATSRVRMLLIGASGLRSSSSKLECPPDSQTSTAETEIRPKL